MDVHNCVQLRVEENGFRFNVYFKPPVGDEGILVCHHGIGSSALTFAVFLSQVVEKNPAMGFLTFDARYHGRTERLSNAPLPAKIEDLDIDSLQSDLEAILRQTLPSDRKSRLVLLGHSMGGTLMSKYANFPHKPANYEVVGLVVVDAVEGYAKQSLSRMHSLLNIWPSSFKDVDEAISWHVNRSNLLRNKQSARISVPPLLVKDPQTDRLSWKLDLKRTDSNWDEWFAGLDEYFTTAPAARLLVLAGVGKLDTALTRAQMQGKFQLIVVNEAGHYIQEDTPSLLANAVLDFWIRNSKPIKIIPKFGQLRSE